MVADTLKSASITALDLLPVLRPDTGEGAPNMDKSVGDFVTVTTGGLASTSSLYNMVRVPSNCKLKGLALTTSTALDTNGTITLAFNVGAYYSDASTTTNSVLDGTPPSLAGTLISATAFASAQLAGARQSSASVLTNFPMSKRNKPLWSALALASDPGGYIDIVVAVQAVAATAAAGELGLEARFSM